MSGINNQAYEQDEKIDNGLVLRKKNNGETNADDYDRTHESFTIETPSDDSLSEAGKFGKLKKVAIILITHAIVITYTVFAVLKFFERQDECKFDCPLAFCNPFGMFLFTLSSFYIGILYFNILKPSIGGWTKRTIFSPFGSMLGGIYQVLWSRIVMFIVVAAAIAGYLIFETHEDFTRLRSLIGVVSILTILFIISAHRTKVNWRPVICGLITQLLLGLFIIRWDVGRMIFECFGEKVTTFLNYGQMGAAFVFGDFLVNQEKVFAFTALPIIFFFSLCVSVLYYFGTIQVVLLKLGWILQSILGTTVCESVNAAANIFLGMSEGPLIIKPYIKVLTHSEIHAIMVSGFATVSGSVLAAYINFGAEASHLITASVMAAPTSLALSKLVWPETEESKTTSDNMVMEKSADSSALDAASNGAAQGIMLILNIIANLVAFVAVIAFADGILQWLTYLVGFDNIGIQDIFGKVFIPVSWVIGVAWEDCEAVGSVIATKTIVNEFVAFEQLGRLIDKEEILPRSAAIATFAICGFANPSSMGIMIGALSALAPERRPSITKVALRAFITGCAVSFTTASIAGLLMTDEMISGGSNRVKLMDLAMMNSTDSISLVL